jgi:hypothetical protein
MAENLVMQGSGVMLRVSHPGEGWAFVIGLTVTDQDGKPIEGLKKSNFSLWQISTFAQPPIFSVTEVNAEFPESKMLGLYRVQTEMQLAHEAPHPQQFLFAIRVSYPRRTPVQGLTIIPITYLGKSHFD